MRRSCTAPIYKMSHTGVILTNPPLLLGSLQGARATKGYKNLLVISLGNQTPRATSSITRVQFPIEDSLECFSRDLAGVLLATTALIRHWRDKMGYPVLVHCRRGKSRSSAIVLYYLMATSDSGQPGDHLLALHQASILSQRNVIWRPETIDIIKTTLTDNSGFSFY